VTSVSQTLFRCATEEPDIALGRWKDFTQTNDFKQLTDPERRLLPAVWKNLSSRFTEFPGKTRLKNLYRHSWAKNLLHQRLCEEAIRELAALGIPSIVLKGLALNITIYDDMGIRPAHDFDLLVPFVHASAALEHFLQRGWELKESRPRPELRLGQAVALGRGEFEFDLHWFALREARLPEWDEELWNSATTIRLGGTEACIFCPEHQLLHLIVNGTREPENCYRFLLDLQMFRKRHGATVKLETVRELLAERHLLHRLFYLPLEEIGWTGLAEGARPTLLDRCWSWSSRYLNNGGGEWVFGWFPFFDYCVHYRGRRDSPLTLREYLFHRLEFTDSRDFFRRLLGKAKRTLLSSLPQQREFPAHSSLGGSDSTSFLRRLDRIQRMLDGSVAFWKRAVDWERGGFFGQIDLQGKPMETSPKYVIQQARHLWTFSQLYRFEDDGDAISAICHHQYRFFRDFFWNSSTRSFHAEVDAKNKPISGAVHLYHLSFCLFGLANYAAAFPETQEGKEALEISMIAFEAICQKAWCPEFGFDETCYPERWCPDGKEINTQMHLLESVGELFEASRILCHPQLSRIEEVFRKQFYLICFKAIVERNGRTFCSAGYDRDWTLVNVDRIEYGHDIEVVFLVWHAATRLGLADRKEVQDQLLSLAGSTTEAALDRKLGRWFYAGQPLSGRATEKTANIWTNFEALNGLATAYRLSSEEKYLRAYDRVLEWLETKQCNPQTGEWYYNVDRRGRPLLRGVYGEDTGMMTFAWKSSYHSTRALLAGKQWLLDELSPSSCSSPL
jgi:mannobiose 2-epimerase